MINLNIFQFTKSYCLMLIMMSIVGVGSFSACNKKSKIESNQNPDDSNAPKFTLKITKTGKGSVGASWYGTTSYGQATDAQLTAGVKVTKDATVQLYATPDASMPYVTWNNIIAKNSLEVTMSQDQDIAVSFSTTPLITHSLTMNVANNDTTLKVYADQYYTIPITDMTKIAANQKIYLKTISNKIITSITGIDANSLSTDKKTATITMDADKTITATLDIDLTAFVFTQTATTATLIKYTGQSNIVEIPSTYNRKPVTAIGNLSTQNYNGGMFHASVKNVIIPNSVTSIGDYSFSFCDLSSITIPNSVTSIGKGTFYYCSQLTTLTIPNSVMSIGYDAFNGCQGLTSITIGNGVTSIGYDAFNCKNVTTINIGSGLTSLYALPLEHYNNLTTINIDVNNPRYASIDGVLFSKTKDTLIKYPCGRAGTYSTPNSVTHITGSAFTGCTGLKSLIIGNSVTSIGDGAFSRCKGLTSLAVGNGIKSANYLTFNGTTIETLNLNTNIFLHEQLFGQPSFSFFNSCKSSLKTVILGENAFVYSTTFVGFANIENIYINYSRLEVNAFLDIDTRIKKLTITLGSKTTGDMPFGFSSSLSNVININVDVNNPRYTSIDGVLFSKAKDTIFAYPIGRVGAYTIPNSVTSIGDGAFSRCKGLTSIDIPNSVTSIGGLAFYNCSSLTSITIPNSVKSIERGAFEYCTGLTSVTIPNSVTSIGDDAFSSCSGLTSVTMQGTPPTLGGNAFYNTASTFKIYVPHAVFNTYYSVPGWNSYASKLQTIKQVKNIN